MRLATDAGPATFWAENAPETDGAITFHILNYEPFFWQSPRSTITIDLQG